MMPGGRNRIPPHGRAPAPPPPPKGSGKGVMAQTPRQMHPNEVHAVVMTLMQGQTIPLQYGQWVQWDVNSWVDIAHSYRYGVLFGVQVEVDYPRVGLRQRMPTVPGVNASLPLQPKQMPVVGSDSEEEADPGVPFEHGLSVQAHGKVPPKMWVAHQAKGTLPKPKGPVVPAMAPMPGTLLTKQLPMGTTAMTSPTMGATSMTSPTMGATSTTSPTTGTTSRPIPILGMTSRPSSSGETMPAVAPVQQTMGHGAGPMVTDATLSYMLRMTGELRSEQSSGSAATPRPAELGLRPVVRPAKPAGSVTVEIVEEDGDQISITSRSSSQST